jgi:hypothetical protein
MPVIRVLRSTKANLGFVRLVKLKDNLRKFFSTLDERLLMLYLNLVCRTNRGRSGEDSLAVVASALFVQRRICHHWSA